MKRRDFLRNGLLIAGAVSIPGLAKPFLSKILSPAQASRLSPMMLTRLPRWDKLFFQK
ncbi:MAG: hypothetical protein IPN18_19620 [Ignavibacteriales bacterium]|nr:hypothetical protein [Ignavibacteriales bacterium]